MTKKEFRKTIENQRHTIEQQKKDLRDLVCQYGDMADLVTEVITDFNVNGRVSPETLYACQETQRRHQQGSG